MKERATYEEYFRVLLVPVRKLPLTWGERATARLRIMSLWAVHLVSPSTGGLVNFPYHLGRVIAHDPSALVFLPLAIVQRVLSVAANLLGGRAANR